MSAEVQGTMYCCSCTMLYWCLCVGEVKEQRTFPAEVLKKGSPNLLVVPPGTLFCIPVISNIFKRINLWVCTIAE